MKLILDFMVDIKHKNVQAFADLIPTMLEQNGFTEFIDSIMFETKISSQI